MQRILFAKVEAWLVLLLAILAVAGAILFGAMVLETERGAGRLRSAGELAVSLAEVPRNLQTLMSPDDRMVAPLGRGLQGTGWSTDPAAAEGLGGYLLLSRYDGDLSRHVVELRSLPGGEVRHTWRPDADALFEGVEREWPAHLAEVTNWNRSHFRALHPYLLPDGSIILKDQSPLFRVSPCGEEVWRQDDHLFHHSTESDGEGGFWIPSFIVPSRIEGSAGEFRDDALARVDADGRVMDLRSLTEVMIAQGFGPMLFGVGGYVRDPMHLNDIQPVLEDGPHWRAGDLFLSLRHKSMIVLYRPSTDEIVWTKQGPWMGQHDVDIVDDHTIAVFNNDAFDRGAGGYVDGASDVVLYDFATDSVSTPFHDAMERHRVFTLTEGLSELLPSGHLLVEQTNAGRVLIMDRQGELAVEFVNRAGDGRPYDMGWSRYVDQAAGDEAMRGIAASACDP